MNAPPDLRVRPIGREGGKLRFHLLNGASDRPVYSGLANPEDAEDLAKALDDIVACCPAARPVIDEIEQQLVAAGRVQPSDEWEPPTPFESTEPPPPRPPLDAGLPPGLAHIRDYVYALATAMQVPPDLAALGLFAVAAAAGARKFEVWPGDGDWREVCAIWTLILMESGSRKSPVLRALLEPLHSWQSERRRQNAPAVRRYEDELAILKERIAGLRKQAAQDGNDGAAAERELRTLSQQAGPTRPIGDDLILTDSTTEALARHLVENGERALIASAEADILDVVLGRYSKGEPKLGLLCKAYSGEPEVVKRIGRTSIDLENPVLSIVLAVQPEGIREALANVIAEARGFWARCLKAAPPSLVGSRELDPPAVPADLVDAYNRALRSVLDVPLSEQPHRVELTAGARRLLRDHRRALEPRLAADLHDRQAWAAKLTGNLLRIALVLHLLEHGGVARAQQISAATMAAALAWESYLVASEQRVATMAGIDPDVVLARKLVHWLEREGRLQVTERDLVAENRTRTQNTMAQFKRPIQLLLDHGYLRRAEHRTGPRGGRPSTRLLVNPFVLRQQLPAE